MLGNYRNVKLRYLLAKLSCSIVGHQLELSKLSGVLSRYALLFDRASVLRLFVEHIKASLFENLLGPAAPFLLCGVIRIGGLNSGVVGPVHHDDQFLRV